MNSEQQNLKPCGCEFGVTCCPECDPQACARDAELQMLYEKRFRGGTTEADALRIHELETHGSGG